MSKALFFDFFGVIGCEITSVWFKNNNVTEGIPEIRREVFSKMDDGSITEEENYQILEKRLNIPAERIRKEWRSMFYVNTSLVSLIDELRKEHRVYILSNAASSYLNELIDEYDLRRHFDGIFISSDLKKIKPHEDFYLEVTKRLKIEPSDAVMTDDNAVNIEGAEKAGLEGIVFKDTEQYFKDLKKII